MRYIYFSLAILQLNSVFRLKKTGNQSILNSIKFQGYEGDWHEATIRFVEKYIVLMS